MSITPARPIGRVPLPVSPHRPAPYTGPAREEILALRREYLNPGMLLYFDEPLCIVEGHMQYVWDEQGRQYLDAMGGIVSVSVGHCHPHVTALVAAQLERLVHTTTVYLHPTAALYGREIARHMPAGSGLTQTYFGNSGSEANEYALLMARVHTGRAEVLALRSGYHGGTSNMMRVSGLNDWKFPTESGLSVRHCAPGYCYRCPFGGTYPACDLRCARSIEDVIRHESAGDIACFIAEPIQGVGGVVVPPPEYFQIAYEIVRRYGGVCIADEVQTGWGRTGAHFWGFENFGVVPDIVTMAKGIGNGAPLSAVTTRPEIAAALTRKMHFNTFAGSPLSMTHGLATLQVIDAEHTQQRAAEMGAYLKAKLLELQEKHLLIGDVRGFGLLVGVELVNDRRTRAPATAAARRVAESARDRGLLVSKSGCFWNTIRLAPPMCVTRDDVDFLVDCLDACLADVHNSA
jgi:alanine-glyoxylate transaminase / (R)-3-amino-2-methylpropionate-pyruvate transaminase